MALHVPKAPGFASMLKDGSRHFSGIEEAVNRNISACKEFADTLKTAYGPNGMNKMVVNHLEKLFVTNDAATIINELDVEHPAAKIMTLASQMQEQEVGDGTNFVIIFCGALLEGGDELLRMGLSPSEIANGYELAMEKVQQILPTLVVDEVKDVRDSNEVLNPIRTSIMSKHLGNEKFISELVIKACTSIMNEKSTSFNVDNIRVCKILGSSLRKSEVFKGLVFKRNVESTLIKKSNAKVVVYTCPIDITHTETKGTVLLKTAEELKNFSQGEENLLESQIKAIADTGVNVLVSGGKVGDMAMHFLNKYNIMAVRLMSKFDIRRVSKATDSSALTKMDKPTPEDLGFADEVYLDELGDTQIVVFKIGNEESKLSTIVLRGATNNFLDDIERAINDGVNTYKALTKNGKLLAGAGACEIELARQLEAYGDTLPGLEQYAVKKFASALEVFIKVFAENSGLKSNEVLAKMYAAHHEGNTNTGFNIDPESNGICDAKEKGIMDLFLTKLWGMEYATNAANTILKVDQIIMAKRAGGPKPRAPNAADDD